MHRFLALLVGISLCATSCSVGRDGAIEQQREAVVALVESVEWPDGYGAPERFVEDPSSGVANERGGWVAVVFSKTDRSLDDIAGEFDSALRAAGLTLDAMETPRCDGEEIFALYESRDPFTNTRFTVEEGRVRVSFGWDVRSLDVDRTALDYDLRIPECDA